MRSFVRERGDGPDGRPGPRRADELVPVPQGDPDPRRPGPARGRLRLPRPRPRRPPDRLRLLVVGTGALDRRGARRARDRALPPRRPRHRRADRLRVGGAQPRAGAVADRAQHPARPGELPPPVGDGPVRDPRARRAVAAQPANRLRDALPLAGDRRSVGDHHRRARTPTARCCAAGTAAAPSCGSCAASSSPTRSGGCSGTASRRRDYPARIVWGERDPALGLEQLRIAQRVLGVDEPVLVPAKHFLQEDQAAAVAHAIADLAAPLG